MRTLPLAMRLRDLSSVFLSVAILTCGEARADEAGGQPIIVTGEGLGNLPGETAYGSQTLDRERLVTTASGRLEDALGQVAGFQQYRRSDSRSSNPSAQGVTLRALGGNASSRALVLLDGVPMADPFFGYIPFSAVDPELLSAARVTRGGGTGAFGAGALAGTIELESANAAQLGTFRSDALVNDRGETSLSAAVAPSLGQGFAVISGQWDRGQGFWTTPVSGRQPANVRARYDSWSVGLRGVAQVASDLELQVRGLVFDDRRTLRFAGADSFSKGQDASLRLVGRGRWQFDLVGYVQARDFGNIVISSSSFKKTLDQRKTPSTGIGGKFELRPPVGGGVVLRLGSDVRISSGELQEESYTGNGSVTRAGGRNGDLGIYSEADWMIGKLVLTGGLRGDRWTISDGHYRKTTLAGAPITTMTYPDRAAWELSFRAGAVLNLAPAVALRGAVYDGLRQPTLNELYRPFVVFPVTTRANAALRNEASRGYEAGIDLAPAPGVTLALTAFDNRISNAIANVTIDSNLRERRNVDAVTSRGVEVSGTGTLGRIQLTGSLAFTDAHVQASGNSADLNGMRPAQTARWAAFGRVAWHPLPNWTVSASLRHTGAQFEDDLEQDILPAATTVDAFVSAPLGPVEFIVRGENLLNETVVTRNSQGTIDLGAPRTVWAGVRLAL